jgi:hypothetical protein
LFVTPYASRIDACVVALCAAGVALSAVLVAPAVLQNGDLYWHIASGRWMIDNQAVLRIDPFSLTFAGHPWQTQDWLSEVALALAYVGAGWSGVLALTAACAALAAGLLAFHMARWLRGPLMIGALVLAFGAAAGGIVASPFLLALPLFAIWTAGLANARAEHRAPSFKLIAVMLVWANLNASFLVGFVVLAALGLEAVTEEKTARLAALRGWAVFAGLAIVASAITPYGLEGLAHPFRMLQAPDFDKIRTLVPLVIALPAAALLLQSKAQAKPLRLLLLTIGLVLALIEESAQLLFAAGTLLLLARPVASALELEGLPSRAALKPSAVFAVLAVLAVALRLVFPIVRSDETISPKSAFAHLPPALAHSAVLNEDVFGGFLIFHDVRPFIDSRPLYSRTFRSRYESLARPDAALLNTTLARHRIRWTIFSPGNPAIAAMDARKDWRRLYADQWAVIHVRSGAR